MRFLLTALCALLSLSCDAHDAGVNDMKSTEQAANERARKELVAYMSLEVMFPDPQVRALAEAAADGQIRKIEVLVEQGVDVNARGARDATPLFFAMRSSNLEGFTKLLELGADPNVVFEDGGSVMHWAIHNQNIDFLKVALKHGGDSNLRAGQDSRTPIFDAIGVQREKIDILLENGANVNVKDSYGITPTMLAAARGSFDVVYKLLNNGADFNAQSNSGHTLVDIINDIRPRMDPEHELYSRMEDVIKWLKQRGVEELE